MIREKKIQLDHGGGGLLSRKLIDEEIVSRFGDGPLDGLPDGAALELNSNNIVFSTDSFVIDPIIFPGGNIGNLAVHGTVNDISVSGGNPKWLSLALILEEGLEFSFLMTILDSVKEAAQDCSVVVATGDTKVVAKGQCDGIFINTAGIGEAIVGYELSADRIEIGDVVISSGNLGDHGMAVLAKREGIDALDSLKSDTAPVHRLVNCIKEMAPSVKFMRDPTRGGAAAVLNEMVENRNIGITLKEENLPFSEGAKGIAEVMGMDLLHIASEGRMLLVCKKNVAKKIVGNFRNVKEGKNACIIGEVTDDAGRVLLETAIGGCRLVDVPQGELLPRIC